jgi:hypothetical protein
MYVCACMYVYIYIYIYIDTYINTRTYASQMQWTHTCMFSRTYAYMCTYTLTYMGSCTPTHIHKVIHTYIQNMNSCTHTQVVHTCTQNMNSCTSLRHPKNAVKEPNCAREYVFMHAYIYTHTHTHTHTHTCTHKHTQSWCCSFLSALPVYVYTTRVHLSMHACVSKQSRASSKAKVVFGAHVCIHMYALFIIKVCACACAIHVSVMHSNQEQKQPSTQNTTRHDTQDLFAPAIRRGNHGIFIRTQKHIRPYIHVHTHTHTYTP